MFDAGARRAVALRQMSLSLVQSKYQGGPKQRISASTVLRSDIGRLSLLPRFQLPRMRVSHSVNN
jgi:hypothetical protein